GAFGFVHRSVMEWLVADHAAKAVQAGSQPEVLRQGPMSVLMADFFRDLAGREFADEWARREIVALGGSAGAANALLVLRRLGEGLGMGAGLAGRVLRGADFSGQDLRGADLLGADLQDALLVDTHLEGANLIGASL